MLIEALQLLRNQREQGFDETSAHESFSTKLGAYKTLRLRLKHDGSIHSIEPFPKDNESAFWTLQKGTSAKTERFPALRLMLPLVKLEASAAEWELLEKVKHKSSDNEVIKQIRECLWGFFGRLELGTKEVNRLDLNPQDYWIAWKEKAKPILAWDDIANATEIERLKACVEAFGKFTGFTAWQESDKKKSAEQRTENAKCVAQSLITSVRNSMSRFSDKDELEALIHLVVGKRVKKKSVVEKIESAQLCIDYYDPISPAATIYTRTTHPVVKRQLPKSDVKGICALTGEKMSLLETKFPLWDGKLFVSSVYSKNEAAPCNARYGRAGLAGFQVSEQLARWLPSGLEQMTDAGREGKTWTKLYNGKYNRERKREEQDLLLVYPSFPVGELSTIDVFTPRIDRDRDEEDEKKQRFETLAEHLCTQLKAAIAIPQQVPSYLQVLLVRKVSEGQIQLVFSDCPTVEHFEEALGAWKASGRNLPPMLKVPLPSKRGAGEIRWFVPRLLFPEEISRLLMHQWMRDGTESSRVEAPSIGMVFDLFLRKEGVWEGHAERLLELTLARSATLLTAAGHLLHKYADNDPEHWPTKWHEFVPKTAAGKMDEKKPDPRYHFARTISLIGSLLHAMNSTTNDYMNQSAFYVGKLLAMMDELHKCYCVAVREGDIPNALIGNGLLGRAAESPARAIEELLDRSRIYLGWAKTAEISVGANEQKKKAVSSAREVLLLAGPLAEQLHAADGLESELTPVRKAHLFLGYLAPVLERD
ncbi:MAG: hypothetical protein HY066_07810 [Betaproteobacteria bacterium]|nr:hypothetical protein [Betaproteobacteria bacterium]